MKCPRQCGFDYNTIGPETSRTFGFYWFIFIIECSKINLERTEITMWPCHIKGSRIAVFTGTCYCLIYCLFKINQFTGSLSRKANGVC